MRYRNDYYPTFGQSTPATFSLYENATVGTNLLTFTATDQDTGIAGIVKFLLIPNKLSWLFTLESSTGNLNLAHSLDRENISSYVVIVRAVDSAPSPFELSRDHHITIDILDINDNAPKFASSVMNITVPETVAAGQVAFYANATDSDAGENARCTYSVLWTNDTGKFRLNTTTGGFEAQGIVAYNIPPINSLSQGRGLFHLYEVGG